MVSWLLDGTVSLASPEWGITLSHYFKPTQIQMLCEALWGGEALNISPIFYMLSSHNMV